MLRYEKLLDLKNPRVLDLVYDNIEDKNEDIELIYKNAKENSRKRDISYTINQIISIIFTVFLTLLFVIGLSLILATCIQVFGHLENETLLSIGQYFISNDYKELGDIVLIQRIAGLTVIISGIFLLCIILLSFRKTKDKKKEDSTVKDPFHTLGVSQNDEWKEIQRQFLKKMSYRNRYRYQNYIKAYIDVFKQYIFIEDNKVNSGEIEDKIIETNDINKKKLVLHTIKTTIISFLESCTSLLFLVLVFLLFIAQFMITEKNAHLYDDGTLDLYKKFTYKSLMSVNDIAGKFYQLGLDVQNLLKDTPIGKLDLINDFEVLIFTVIGVGAVIVLLDFIFKKIPYIKKEYQTYKRYLVLYKNQLVIDKYKRIDPFHNQFVLLLLFIVGYGIYFYLAQ